MQLTVPLREITLKKSQFFRPHARSWIRVHVWQLHVDILPAAYSELHRTWGRKGKSDGSHRVTASLQTDTDNSENRRLHREPRHCVQCRLIVLRFFPWNDPDCLFLVLDCSWSLASTYSRYSMNWRVYIGFFLSVLVLMDVTVLIWDLTLTYFCCSILHF